MKLYKSLLFFIAVSGTAQANLIDRGNGMIYDADKNITWLSNANLAATDKFGVSGIASDGKMTWSTAQSWVAALGSANYKGYNDWRLPTTVPASGGGNQSGSEMGHLFYTELGGSYGNSVATTNNQNFNFFTNIMTTAEYWSSTPYASQNSPNDAWFFQFSIGEQNHFNKTNQAYAWAVRTGDVAPVPVPTAFWLLGSALIGLVGYRRKHFKF